MGEHIPAAAAKLNLLGTVAAVESRKWVEGFVRGLAASRYNTRGHTVKEDIVESMRKNKHYSRSTFYVLVPGEKLVLAMYYPKDEMIFYLK
jgi:hypothetical protein